MRQHLKHIYFYIFLRETSIELYHAILKQKILPVSPLIQCEAGRVKTKLFVLMGLKNYGCCVIKVYTKIEKHQRDNNKP